MTRILARAWPRVIGAVSLLAIAAVGVVVGALVAGYRPVVLQTGSMGTTAPPGSLIIAAPVADGDVQPGDILVMRRPGATPVTHRVIEVERQGSHRFAITQGDGNEAPDPAPYPLEGEQLVSRWILPGWGFRLQTVFQPGPALAVVALATLVIALQTLRRIWAVSGYTPHAEQLPAATLAGALPAPLPTPMNPAQRRRKRMAVAAAPLVALMSGGLAWALFQSSDVVASNDFTTAACFDAQLAAVQNGETIHAVNGTVAVPITAVDPARAFVMASVRSTSADPADATVRTRLAGGGTSLELVRFTDDPVPPQVTVAWSVIEYGCGIDVQRGSVSGNGTAQLDVAIAAVDPTTSFVLVSSDAEADATEFGGDDLFIGELSSPSTLTIRAGAGSVFSSQRTFAWQVVTFTDPGDASVQTVTASLGLGVASVPVALPTPADPASTFLLTQVTATSSGPDVGERVVRAHLVDPTTVEITRGVLGDPVDVQVQVVTLRDGSTVRHGTVDFATGQPARTVAIEPVDVSRSTAVSTVAIPGLVGGGLTDHATDDVVGEASATFALADERTVAITRAATSSNSSFGWQVIEWAGPQWWDPAYTFRQRIDVDTASAAAPDAYTVPLTFDHAAFVATGLSLAGGDDIRILRWDGTAWTELDRVLDDGSSWDAVDTTVWFRTVDPIAADSTSSYWLYFGTDTPGPPPADPEAVYLLTEDFDNGGLGDFEDRTAGTAWYAAEPWTRRIPLTVTSGTVSSELTDFPLLVSLTSADLAANAQPDGSDIRFTAADGVTPLAHEIESWAPGAGTLVAWVRIPTLAASADTTIYAYYGAPDAPDQQDVRAVWADDVEAAWHLSRDPSGPAPQLDDSTARNHDGLSAGAMTAADLVPGLAGPAIDLDGLDDLLEVDPVDLGGSTALTLSAWVQVDALVTDARVIAKAPAPSEALFDLVVRSTGAVRGRLRTGGVTSSVEGGAVTLGSWHHLALSWDGAIMRLFLDGTEVATQPAAGALDSDAGMPVTLGNVIAGTGGFDGRIDEARIESAARSAAWMAAAEANQRTPGSFVAVGAVESGTWFDQGTWLYRKPVVVDADLVGADVVDHPLLVQLTDAELAAGAQADARDIVFTDASGTARLDHEVEAYNSATGALSAWVRVPTLSASVDTALFVYYGNAGARDQQDPEAVFGPDAELVLLGSP